MKLGSKWLWGHSCGFLIVEVCFANIPDLSLHFLDLLWHLDFIAEELDSEEDVTDDSHSGSSDNCSDETSGDIKMLPFLLRHHEPRLSRLPFLSSITGLICSMLADTRSLCWCVIKLILKSIGSIQISLLEP